MPTPAPWLIAWVLGALAVLALIVCVAHVARRRVMEQGVALVTCWWRQVDTSEQTGAGSAERRVAPDGSIDPGTTQIPWRRGLLRYDGTGVLVFGSGALSVRPVLRWTRTSVDLGYSRPAGAGDFPGLERPVIVRARVRGESFDLALSVDHYTALRSWVEALPPGWNANVA